ncbi:MAG TPA: hypothetical protein VL087_04790 [Nitrospirota bacterium]|nr:hypothetical protein [Nitrospirota bacterium]
MNYHINRLIKPLTYSLLVVLILFLVSGGSAAQETGTSKVIFIVK